MADQPAEFIVNQPAESKALNRWRRRSLRLAIMWGFAAVALWLVWPIQPKLTLKSGHLVSVVGTLRRLSNCGIPVQGLFNSIDVSRNQQVIYDVPSASVLARLDGAGLKFSPDETLLVTGSTGDEQTILRIWDIPPHKQLLWPLAWSFLAPFTVVVAPYAYRRHLRNRTIRPPTTVV